MRKCCFCAYLFSKVQRGTSFGFQIRHYYRLQSTAVKRYLAYSRHFDLIHSDWLHSWTGCGIRQNVEQMVPELAYERLYTFFSGYPALRTNLDRSLRCSTFVYWPDQSDRCSNYSTRIKFGCIYG
ncbi:hypothetical protein D3C73_1274480 [compost metagenome]